jgi:hypothetical protein
MNKPVIRNELAIASNECKAHCRHHVQGSTIWYEFGPSRLYAIDPKNGNRSFPLPSLAEKYSRARGGPGGPHDTVPAKGVAVDFMPRSENACRVFFFVMKTKKIESWEVEWMFQKMRNEAGFVISNWVPIADGQNPETIESLFAEDFLVFRRGRDYFFVTQSGTLYSAPPLKNGEKSRTMKPLWENDNFPIVAVIEDADNDKVWLFTKSKRKDETQAVFFEMGPQISPQKFDHAKLAPVRVEGRAKALLEYLPLIRDKAKKQPGK